MKVNLGSGAAYREDWVNVDSDVTVRADIHSDAFAFIREMGPSISELYMGHFLEHMTRDVALQLLVLIAHQVPAGVQVSAVVPDMRAIFGDYLAGNISNGELNDLYVYSYVQPSHHAWCYDEQALTHLFLVAGYADVRAIDPLTWSPVHWKSGPWSRWQCGIRASVPAVPPAEQVLGLGDFDLFGSDADRAGIVERLVADRQMLARQLAEAREELAHVGRQAGRTRAGRLARSHPQRVLRRLKRRLERGS